MSTLEIYEQKASELSNQIIETIEKFAKTNSDLHLPPQIIMSALAELLIQYSIGHVGITETLHLISHLKKSITMSADKRSPQH